MLLTLLKKAFRHIHQHHLVFPAFTFIISDHFAMGISYSSCEQNRVWQKTL